jgi:flagellar motor switch protein FliM
MTGVSAKHLGHLRIRRLLAAVGSSPAPDQVPVQATPYNWRDPHCFNPGQHNRLTQVMKQVAAQIAEAFARSGRGQFEVSLETIGQHFAEGLCHQMDLHGHYCLTFASDKGPPGGFASISGPTATAWVTWLLGDSDSTRAPDRAFSSLEESLLCDLLTAAVETFLAPLRPHQDLRPAPALSKGQPSIQFELTEEVCTIAFQVRSVEPGSASAGPAEASRIAFLLPCSRLAALAGKPMTAAPRMPPQELSQVLVEHLHRMPVTITAVLASTTLRFQEILDLSAGDILMLDKPVQGSAELILDGRTVFRCRPARAQGKYAVVIAACETRQTPQTAKGKTPKETGKG